MHEHLVVLYMAYDQRSMMGDWCLIIDEKTLVIQELTKKLLLQFDVRLVPDTPLTPVLLSESSSLLLSNMCGIHLKRRVPLLNRGP